MGNKNASGWAAILLATAIAAVSFLRVSHLGRTLRVNGTLHYGVHVALFALLTLLLVRSTNSPATRWILFLTVLCFGYGTEFYEHLKDTYPVETPDVLADTVGACIGMAGWLVRRQGALRRVNMYWP